MPQTQSSDAEVTRLIESTIQTLNSYLETAEARDMVVTIEQEDTDIQGYHRTRFALRAIMKRLYKPMILRP